MFTLSKNTTKIFTGATVLCIGMGVICAYSYYSLQAKETEYRNKLQLVADYSTQVDQATEAEVLLDRTESARLQLDNYFLTIIKIAEFLETVEQYARENKLEITSHSIETEVTAVEGISVVEIPFSVHGPEVLVVDFVELLETIPYHSYVDSLQIQSDLVDPTLAQAEIVLRVSYLEND